MRIYTTLTYFNLQFLLYFYINLTIIIIYFQFLILRGIFLKLLKIHIVNHLSDIICF